MFHPLSILIDCPDAIALEVSEAIYLETLAGDGQIWTSVHEVTDPGDIVDINGWRAPFVYAFDNAIEVHNF